MAFPISLTVTHGAKASASHKNIVFVDKAKLILVTLPDKTSREYIYPQDMVVDGDVIKRDEFRTSLAKWIEESHIKAVDTILIVSIKALFEKTLTPGRRARSVEPDLVNAFIDAIPLQHPTTIKRTEKTGAITVIAANRDLLTGVYLGFDKAGCNVVGVYPEDAPILDHATPIPQADIIERARKQLTEHNTKGVLRHEFDILPQSHRGLTQMSVTEAAQQPVQPWVAVMIVILLVVGAFGIGYFQYFQARQEQIAIARKRSQLLAQQQLVDKTGPQPVSANITPGDTTSPHSAVVDALSPTNPPPAQPVLRRVQIVYNDQTQKLFDDVYERLRKTGQYLISNQMTTRTLSENRALLAPSLDATSAAKIQEIVEGVGITTTRKEATIDDFDIVIELGNYTPTAPSGSLPSPTP